MLSCSTLASKGPPRDPDIPSRQLGVVFSGVRMNLHGWTCLPQTFRRRTFGKLLIPLAVTELAVDLPFSTLADVLLVPVDLFVKSERPAPSFSERRCPGGPPGARPGRR